MQHASEGDFDGTLLQNTNGSSNHALLRSWDTPAATDTVYTTSAHNTLGLPTSQHPHDSNWLSHSAPVFAAHGPTLPQPGAQAISCPTDLSFYYTGSSHHDQVQAGHSSTGSPQGLDTRPSPEAAASTPQCFDAEDPLHMVSVVDCNTHGMHKYHPSHPSPNWSARQVSGPPLPQSALYGLGLPRPPRHSAQLYQAVPSPAIAQFSPAAFGRPHGLQSPGLSVSSFLPQVSHSSVAAPSLGPALSFPLHAYDAAVAGTASGAGSALGSVQTSSRVTRSDRQSVSDSTGGPRASVVEIGFQIPSAHGASFPSFHPDSAVRLDSSCCIQCGKEIALAGSARRDACTCLRRMNTDPSITDPLSALSSKRALAPKEESAIAQGPAKRLRLSPFVDSRSPEGKVRIAKPTYVRPVQPKKYCHLCDDNEGFRGEHELKRHMDRVHNQNPVVYICVNADGNPDFYKCKACRNEKIYNREDNAACHLRRRHFNPRKSRGKGRVSENRGGKGGGDKPPMQVLRDEGWIKEKPKPYSSHDADASSPEDLVDDPSPTSETSSPRTFDDVNGAYADDVKAVTTQTAYLDDHSAPIPMPSAPHNQHFDSLFSPGYYHETSISAYGQQRKLETGFDTGVEGYSTATHVQHSPDNPFTPATFTSYGEPELIFSMQMS